MLEQLTQALQELQQELAEINATDDTMEIEEKVTEFKAKLQDEYAGAKLEKISDKKDEIAAVTRLLERENAKLIAKEEAERALDGEVNA